MDNALLVSGQGTLLEEVRHKLLREGLRVSILTDGRQQGSALRTRSYHCSYASDSIKDVMDSCRPDVVVFFGAYDPSFSWHRHKEDASYTAYMAGLANILIHSSLAGVNRFIYLSSESVFEDAFLTPIGEDTPTLAHSKKGTAVSLGETMVSHFGRQHHLDTVIARIGGLFFIPSDARECRETISALCMQAVVNGQIRINTKIKRSAVYVKDAAEAVFLLVHATDHKRNLYHIAGKEAVTEDLIAGEIQKSSNRKITIIDGTVGVERVTALRDQAFSEEFGFTLHYGLDGCVSQIVRYMQGHIKQFSDTAAAEDGEPSRERRRRIFAWLLPYLEACAVFAAVVFLTDLFSGVSYLAQLDLFLLYVLLFSMMHGLYLSIFTGFLSVIGYFFVSSDKSLLLDLLMNMETYVWIAQLFIVGMSVGTLRDRLQEMQTEKNAQIDYLDSRLDDLKRITDDTNRIKDYFVQQVINNTENLGFFTDISSRLDAANENEVLFIAFQILSEVMNTDHSAIYSVTRAGYLRLVACSSSMAYDRGSSILARDYHEVFEALQKDRIYVNRTMNRLYPAMASASMDANGEIRTVFFLWELPLERMTLYYCNMLRSLTMLIHSAARRTLRYLDAIRGQRYYKKTSILEYDAFCEIFEVYHNAARKGLTRFSLLRLEAGDKVKKLDPRLRPLLRSTDYIGFFNKNTLFVLLPNADEKDASVVVGRLHKSGFRAEYYGQALPQKPQKEGLHGLG